MLPLATILLGLSAFSLYANGASLSLPGSKIGATKRSLRIPRTLQEPNHKRDSNIGISPLVKKDSTSLFERQAGTCPVGTSACPDDGCCDGACCGDGCCSFGYTCQFVGTTPGCCPIGESCSDTISGCTDVGYVECANYDFCCPAGQTCYTDANNNAQCGSTGASSDPPSISNPLSSSARPTTTAGTGSGNGNGNANTSLNGGVTTTRNVNSATNTVGSSNTNIGNSNLRNGAAVQGKLGFGVVALTMLVGGLTAL